MKAELGFRLGNEQMWNGRQATNASKNPKSRGGAVEAAGDYKTEKKSMQSGSA